MRTPSLRRSEAHNGQHSADDPAHGPGGPYAAIAHAGGEYKREYDAQYEVGKGGDHELLHQAGTPQHAVGHQLGRHDEVERRDDPQEGHAGFQRQPLRGLQEYAHQRGACEEVQCRQRQAQHPNQPEPRKEACPQSPRCQARYRYSERPGALTTQTQIKAEAYFSDRFARFNDGVLIISGDLDAGVVKRILGRYLGGVGIQKGSTPRRQVEFRQRNGTVTIDGDKGPSGIHVVMEAPVAVTSDNYYLSLVAAQAMQQALIWELASYGFTANVSVGPMTQPQERFYMEISCFPVPVEGLPADVVEPDVDKAITAVRAAIVKSGKRLPAQADVQAWKNGLSERVKALLSTPEGFTMAQQVRYALNKDLNSRYAESLQAITPEKVRGFLASIAAGGAVEYIVE